MLNGICSVLAILLCLAFNSFSKDEDLKPEDLVAQHVKSLGSPDALAQTTTRSITGTSTFKFISGATGQAAGQARWVSEKGKQGMVLRYGQAEYPGEHFAYDGKDVMVNRIMPGLRSPLGDFLYRHGGIMKSETWGGTLNVGWPLLNLKESGAKAKSLKKKKIEEQELYELEYVPKQSMEDVKVKMYFDPANFRHVMTEYRLRLQLTDASMNVVTTNYVLTERFENFKDSDGIALPYQYSLAFLADGSSSSLQTLHTLDIAEIDHNGNIDPRFYAAEK